MYAVSLRHEDEIARCKFFEVSGHSQTLLKMHDIKFLIILEIMCDVVGDQQADRKCDSQTIQQSNGPSRRANKGQQIKTDNVDLNYADSNMFRLFLVQHQQSSRQKNKPGINAKDTIGCFEGTFSLHIEDSSEPYQVPPRE